MSTTSKGAAAVDNNNDTTNKEEHPLPLPRIVDTVTVGATKWLKLETISYKDQEGKDRLWDYATRTTKKSKHSTDAVAIIPLLKRPYAIKEKKGTNEEYDDVFDTLLVEQYRPPLGKRTLEFPAGLIDEGETPQEAALRELHEETGYVGESGTLCPPIVSNQVCMSPGLCDETVQCVLVVVDLDNPLNKNVTPNPDPGEYITVHRVSLKDGLQTLLNTNNNTTTITNNDDSLPSSASSPIAIQGLYLFAMGLEIGQSMK